MVKVMLTSRQGLTRCPDCLSHTAVGGSLDAARCAMCGVNLVVARRADGGIFGAKVLGRLSGSASGRLAAAFGVTLAMSACDEPVDERPRADVPASASPVSVGRAVESPDEKVYGGPPMDEPAAPASGLPQPSADLPQPPADAPPPPADTPPPTVVSEPAPERPPSGEIYGGPPDVGDPRGPFPPDTLVRE